MNKMQNINYKIPILILILAFFAPQITKGQDNNQILTEADSLFKERRFVQSLELYHHLYEENEVYTPQMLLKLAYINEGLGEYSKALYYLNVYYEKTTDKAVMDKMEQLAEKHKLAGYDFTDTDLFLNYYKTYSLEITLGALAISFLLFALLVYQKRKKQPVFLPLAGLVVSLFLVALMVNADNSTRLAIINGDNAYLMRGPSSGAGVVDIVKAGHRVSILGQQDVWTEIIWDGSPVYIRKSQLMPIN